jgi:hypothetical protein
MSDYFDHVEHELRAAVRGQEHLPWYVRLRLRHSRAVVVVLAALVIAAPALAAAGLFGSGSSVGPEVLPSRNAGDGVAIPSSVRLLSLRVADVGGEPPWGMRVVRTSRGLACVDVGRVGFGRVGTLGRDGAFGNDGLFHPFSDNYESGSPCVTPDARGNAFLGVSEYGVPASALFGSATSTPLGCSAPASLLGLPARARLRIERRQQSLTPRDREQPACARSELRDVFYGLLGPDAVSVTHETPSGGLVTTPTSGPDGAYLVVLPYQPDLNGVRFGGGSRLNYGAGVGPGAIRAVHYRDGHTCRLPAPSAPRARFANCPAVGYVSPGGPLPTPADVAAPVSARFLVATSYCSEGEQVVVVPCPGRVPPGFFRLDRRTFSRQALLVVSFTSRVAVANGHRYYYLNVLPPSRHGRYLPCARNGIGDQTTSDYRAGQRVTQFFFFARGCRGVIHGDVSLVITTGPTAPSPTGAARGESVGRRVGRFAIGVP